ncbi:IclR family transcriptional regulator [Burkholderia gladioli]|uniref:IclR family transcriptional regulator n=1 Tax=Burkholderia gladioli TaxID=28095 RepID=UPI001640CDC4|nr:IclR family transcriptional regulator [Burkholderia gladioli]MBU9640477.1 IclR family transcriptional regulator [Burkholderia gladioli]MDJ1165426.1 IclR family transcriptional regulator [Burkholderia gladioli pv. gladioli]
MSGEQPGDNPCGPGVLQRSFALIRALGENQAEGSRVTMLAKAVGLTQATVHRLLQGLIAEQVVEQDERTKRYRLSVAFFAMAAQAGNPNGMRTLCRPALLRLCASLGDTIFLMVKSSFDAVCLDICEGPFPIRSFTGNIGGRVALGVGQGSLAILAFQPEDEREEIIRFNVPRMRGQGVLDEVYLRTEIDRVRALGYAGRNSGVLEDMAGVAVPILDRNQVAVAALSVGTLSTRLTEERLPTVVQLLKRQAEIIGPQMNPFDAAMRDPIQGLTPVYSTRVSGTV